ncbi:MAG: hypothetical protein ACYDEX_03505 [Mobilitalea sp.]
MKMKLRTLLTALCAAVLAMNIMPINVAQAAEENAYLAYADEAWIYQYWGEAVDTGVIETNAVITGAGQYTVGLDFTKTAEGKALGLAFIAPMINNGEASFPGYCMTVDSIMVNGAAIEFTKGYTSSDDAIVTRANIYNTWVTEIPIDARTADGNLEGISAVTVDPTLFAEVTTLSVTFTLSEGTGAAAAPTVAPTEAPYVAPSAFKAFIMYSAAENGWECFEPLESGANTATVLGDGTYTVTLKASDIAATGAPTTPNVLIVDIPELATAMEALGKNINNYTEDEKHLLPTDLEISAEVYVDGAKINCKSENINYGNIEEKGTFRLEIYNIWGLHGAAILDNPPVFPEAICPESEISVVFKLKGTGFNTEAAAAAEAALVAEAAAAATPTVAAAATATTTTTAAEEAKDGLSTGLIIGIIAAIVAIAVVAILVLKKKKK